jgi:hypothetical protein
MCIVFFDVVKLVLLLSPRQAVSKPEQGAKYQPVNQTRVRSKSRYVPFHQPALETTFAKCSIFPDEK